MANDTYYMPLWHSYIFSDKYTEDKHEFRYVHMPEWDQEIIVVHFFPHQAGLIVTNIFCSMCECDVMPCIGSDRNCEHLTYLLSRHYLKLPNFGEK